MHSQLRMFQQISELQLRPLNVVMKRILDRLGRKDPANIFAEPVSLEEVGSLVPIPVLQHDIIAPHVVKVRPPGYKGDVLF